jgi:hypothetical protein
MQGSETRLAIDASLVNDWIAEAKTFGAGEDWGRQRHALRYPWTAQLEIHYWLPSGRRRSVRAGAIDVSKSGMGLRARDPIPLFSEVIITRAGENVGVPGKAVLLTQTVGAHVIGVDFHLSAQDKL